MADKYRFDDAFEKVYEYENGIYTFIGNYLAFGINKNMTDEEKIIELILLLLEGGESA